MIAREAPCQNLQPQSIRAHRLHSGSLACFRLSLASRKWKSVRLDGLRCSSGGNVHNTFRMDHFGWVCLKGLYLVWHWAILLGELVNVVTMILCTLPHVQFCARFSWPLRGWWIPGKWDIWICACSHPQEHWREVSPKYSRQLKRARATFIDLFLLWTASKHQHWRSQFRSRVPESRQQFFRPLRSRPLSIYRCRSRGVFDTNARLCPFAICRFAVKSAVKRKMGNYLQHDFVKRIQHEVDMYNHLGKYVCGPPRSRQQSYCWASKLFAANLCLSVQCIDALLMPDHE